MEIKDCVDTTTITVQYEDGNVQQFQLLPCDEELVKSGRFFKIETAHPAFVGEICRVTFDQQE